ncbi:hypothetical protein [Niabella beijingensis]|uniref:hypothetical protein n=1 Tax=Niabella beijingensis TaxID=2872700 RepID=UPI001CBDC254|nr:hypothetical protein [Niabella beijingensis]MBZ4190995.1 hypothetical protein [Niabella beijingensis]
MELKLYPELVELALNFSERNQFYVLRIDERAVLNDVLHRNEKLSYFHATIQGSPYGDFRYHIEFFDRSLKNRDWSASEKEFLLQIDQIQDELWINTTRFAEVLEIENLKSLDSRARQIVNKLAKNYIGETAARTFNHLKIFYRQPQWVITDINRYEQLGLLFSKFYGNILEEVNKKHLVRFINLMPNTLIQVQESVQSFRVQYEAGCTEVLFKGILDAAFLQRAQLERQMKATALAFEPTDQPLLDQYTGNIWYHNQTGMVQKAALQIQFSFGKNYQKQIVYTLDAICADEVP